VFYQTYAIPHFLRSWKTGYKNVLDRWVISRLNNLIKDTTQKLDKYDVTGAARAIENFVIEDLSLWYIRRSRRRFHPVVEQSSLRGRKTGKDFEEASATLNFVLLTLTKLTAPFIPFLSEEIYQKIHNQCLRFYLKQSVHLEDWPKANKRLIDKTLEKKMEKAREIVASALAERAKTKIKVRQPLNELRIRNYELRKEKELLDLIREEINVKKITFGKTLKLDTKITPELREEGIVREIIRNIQEMRKKAGFKPRDKILVRYSGTLALNKILARNKSFILKETKAKDFCLGERPKQVFAVERQVKIDQQSLWLAIKKIKQ